MIESLAAWVVSLGHWNWLILGLLLIVLEVFSPGAFFMWLGISAGVTGIISWLLPSMVWEWQFVVFAVLSVASIAVWRVYLRKRPIETDRATLNKRGSQYIGRRFTLDEPMVNGRGRIQVDDTFWRTEGPDLVAGTTVEVVAVDGVVLRVRTAEEDEEVAAT